MKKITLLVLSVIIAASVSFIGCTKEETSTNIAFNNKVFTTITVVCNGETKTVAAGSSVTFYDVKGGSIAYTAETKGTTSAGTQVGLKMTWGSSISLAGGSLSYDLVTNKDYFFLNVKNTGTQQLKKLYVNFGLTSQTFDDLVFPANSTTYTTGYYSAYTNTKIQLTSNDDTFTVSWTQGTGNQFIFPWTDNQTLTITNTAKSLITATSNPLTKGATPQYAVGVN